MLRKILEFFKPEPVKLGAYLFFWIGGASLLLWGGYLQKNEWDIVKCSQGGCGSIILPMELPLTIEAVLVGLFILPLILLLFISELCGLHIPTTHFTKYFIFPSLIFLFIVDWFPFCMFWKIIEIFVKSCEKTLSSSEHSE